MKCYIVQHGLATSKEENPQRPLSERGVYDIRCLARALQQQHTDLTHIYHSGKERSLQTAMIIADALNLSEHIKQIDGIGPVSDAELFARKIKTYADDLLVASHMPFVQNLCDALLGEKRKQEFSFAPGKLVCLEIERGWAELLWQS